MADSREQTQSELELIGLGYTLATGQMFCSMSTLQRYAEDLMGEPILTHEFADKDLWGELRARFEHRVVQANL